MASTLLEQTRAAHEDCERLERLIVKDFRTDAKGHRERLAQGHRVRRMLDQLQAQAQKLERIYADEDNARKEEIAALRGENMFSVFYERVKEVRDYHRRYPNLDVTEAEAEDAALRGEEARVEFSGEEAGGRYLDLHAHHMAFVNGKFGRQIEYIEYVRSVGDFATLPRPARLTKAYRDYLAGLLEYLEGFHDRTQPLATRDKVYAPLDSFEATWAASGVAGWEDRGLGRGEGGGGDDHAGALDLQAFDSTEELETLGPERLKDALGALGLKTGGTPQQRAARLWLTRDTPLTQLDRKHFARGCAPALVRTPVENARLEASAKEAALLEAKVGALLEALGTVPSDTAANIEKKQARTYEELQAEQAEAEQEEAASDSEEEEDVVYNPLKLPLGWDGKPIPYWLYKLHGLNQEFKCEICGGMSYWGRRAFERHFKEWRHQNGMRALGIPNNKNFYEVTQIADARQLWQSIQEREVGGFKAEAEEEFEDTEGNVYNRRTYEDLKRQGII